ncbi:MAG: DUF2946 family protein [Pseudobdellovibrionaceae bacterium]
MKNRTNQFLLSFLIALAFLVKAMLPAGFMPEVKADGFMTVEICTTDGIVKKLAGGDVPATPSHDEKTAKCPYAPVLSYGDMSHTPDFAALDIFALPPLYEASHALVTHAIPKDWFSTAPPFSV